MIVLTILALTGLGLLALTGRRPASAAETVQTAVDRTAQGIAAATSMAPARTDSGPPGLLLRREPEIRAMNPETLATYVRVVKGWLDQGHRPTEAWWTSYVQAQAEILLRTRVGGEVGSLTDSQLDALLSWLLRLKDAGMPIGQDEESLLLNLEEEHQHRFGGGGR